jgi:prepilin-type N-terminal cleavage/methylation domain-containing protein
MPNRRGFTLIEMLISVTLLLFITGAAVQFLRKQTNLVTSTTAKMDALQNAEFASTQLERELREAGAGVVDKQPMLVQVDSEAITFNANMVSIDSGDVRAVYQMTDADTNGVRVMWKQERRLLPNLPDVAKYYYPDTTYASGAVASGAETISYFFRPDSTTANTGNDYILMRRVNGRAATLVARGIVKDTRDTFPFFTYYKADSTNTLKPILESKMPLVHAMLHGSTADTGSSAVTDSIRAVRIHFLAATRDWSKDRRFGKDTIAYRTVEVQVRLMNSGLLRFNSCGLEPLPATAPTLTTNVPAPANGKYWVQVDWTPSPDDNQAGERDVERYAIFRRRDTDIQFGDPIASIGASKLSYTWVDTAVIPGATYVYGIAPQDCTPQMAKTVNASAPITVNP